MSASHLLLGHPWQFDKDVIYNGRKNTYSFMLNGKKVNLLPLSSQQVREDQLRSQQKEVKSRKGLLLAKKGDIKHALASVGVVFMIWAKQLLQVEGLDLPRHFKELLEEFKDVFLDELPIHFNQQNKKYKINSNQNKLLEPRSTFLDMINRPNTYIKVISLIHFLTPRLVFLVHGMGATVSVPFDLSF
jgi:hypothetical protein